MIKKKTTSILLALCLMLSMPGIAAYAMEAVPVEPSMVERVIPDTEVPDTIEGELEETETYEWDTGNIEAFMSAANAVAVHSSYTLQLMLGYPDNRYFTGTVSGEGGVKYTDAPDGCDFTVPSGWLWMLLDWRDTYGSGVYYTADGHRIGGTSSNGLVIANWNTAYTNNFFSCEQYLVLNADLFAAGIQTPADAWSHWLHYGVDEGRATSFYFDPKEYRELYGDLSAAYGDSMPDYYKHYATVGYPNEGRWGNYNNTYLDANGGSCAVSSVQTCYDRPFGSTAMSHYIVVTDLPTPTRPGYVFDGWYTSPTGGTKYSTGDNCPYYTDFTLYAHWHPGTSAYKVYHYQQKVSGSGYDLVSTQSLSGTTDTTVTPARADYTGFTTPAGQSLTINGNGTASVSYYYTRNQYTVTVKGDSGISSVTGGGSYYYGAAVTVAVTAKDGYRVDRVTASPDVSDPYSFTMPAGNVTISVVSAAGTSNYQVYHYKQHIGGDGYDLADTQSLTGTTDSTVTPAVNSYPGFSSPAAQSVKVKGDGSTNVSYYYTRNKYTVAVGGTGISGVEDREYYFGETVSLAVNPAPGYRLGSAVIRPSDVPLTNDGNIYSFAMPAEDVELIVTNLVSPVTITVPRQLIMGKDAGFTITADNQAGVVTVQVPDQVVFTQKGKHETVTGRVSLSDTTLTSERHTITGAIVTDGFSAGSWEASFYLEIDFVM